MKSLTVIFYFLASISIFCQIPKLDSIDIELKKAIKINADAEKLNILLLQEIDIANQYSNQRSLQIAINGLRISIEKDDSKFIASMYYQIGRSYRSMGQYDHAIVAYNKSVDYLLKIKIYGAAAFVYNDIANIYFALKIYDVARDIYFYALDICNKHLDSFPDLKLPKAVSYNNIGLVNYKLNKFDSALFYYQKGYEIRKEANYQYLLPHSYNYLAKAHISLGDLKEAEGLFIKSITESEKLTNEINKGLNTIKPGDMRVNEIKDFKLEAKLGLMELYYLMGNIQKGFEIKKYLEQSISDLTDLELIKYYLSLLQIYKNANNTDELIINAKKLLHIADNIDSKFDKSIALRELISAYKLKNDIKNAYKYFEIYDNLRDTLFNSKFNEIAYGFQKAEALKSYKTSINEIEEKKSKEIQYQLLIRNISILFVIISIIISIYLYLRYKLKNRLAENLKIANETLEIKTIKVNNLNLELQKSEEHLKLLNDTKDKFFAIIAHDLKNPIGSIKLLSELIFNEYKEITDSERLDYIKILKNTSQNVLNLLINLLDWSRSQRGKIDYLPDNYHLKPIISNIFELLEASAKNKNIKFISKIGDDTIIYADLNMVSTIIRNLISNAIKFSQEGGKIIVECLKKDSNIEISIIDNGIGMSENIQNKLFRYDSRISSQGTKGETGTGLGLILCKELLDKNNGEIWVESKVGFGSKFSFTLKNAD